MTNKYQEALNNLILTARKTEDIRVIQELVNKETPMKVSDKEFENVAFDGYIPIVTGNCQSCDCDLIEVDKYCWNCGQRIDWSKDD